MPSEDLESSLWANFLQRSVFVPSSRDRAFQSLVVQTDELSQIINHFRVRYVSQKNLLLYSAFLDFLFWKQKLKIAS